MTRTFSKSARLLVQNWDMLDEIKRAESELAQTIHDGLLSLEGKLAELPWWSTDWNFGTYGNAQVYIWHKSWAKGDSSAVWLGIKDLSPDSLFGPVTYPEMYLWVINQQRALVPPLGALMDALDDAPGEVGAKVSKLYIVTNPVRKCLPDELDNFDEVVLAPIVDFINFYAGHAEAIGRIVRET